MEKIVNLTLYLITILCFYIILSVGLDLVWKIKFSNNATNINQVCLNLSYSYIAGLIFYFFISYLPFFLAKRKLKSVINFKILNLKKQIESYLQTFSSIEIERKIDSVNFNFISKITTNKSLKDNSYYSEIMGYKMNNYEFIDETKSRVFDLIDGILTYKQYLSSNQIVILEQVKDSDFFYTIKIYNHPKGNILINLEKFKNQFNNDLWVIIQALQKI